MFRRIGEYICLDLFYSTNNSDNNNNNNNNNEPYDMPVPVERIQFKVHGCYGEGEGLCQLNIYKHIYKFTYN